jgi:hypothetical protein
MDGTKVDNGLMRALREGPEVLPDDLNRLHAYLKLIGGLLAEKATDHEPTWAMALAAAAEIETLQGLEEAVAGKAVAVQARSIWGVLTKLAIWESLEPVGEECEDITLRDRLVWSVRRDLERLARGSTPRNGRRWPA